MAPALVVPATGLELSGLRAVIRSARASGSGLMLFAYPQHAFSLELDFLCGRVAARWGALAAMAQVVAEEAPDGSAQLWTFYGYNPVTAEGITGRQPAYWQDPEHFTYRMGGLMLSDMFGGSASGMIGRRLTPGGVADSYQVFLAGRDRYLAANPRFYDELRAVLAPLR